MAQVFGFDPNFAGVTGDSNTGTGVEATSNTGTGVDVFSYGGHAINAYSGYEHVLFGQSTFGPGIEVECQFGGPGVSASCWIGPGVQGEGYNGPGVFGIGRGESSGIEALSEHGPALYATGNSDAPAIHVTAGYGNSAIFAEVPRQAWGLYTIASGDGVGVYANSQNGVALHGISDFGTGVRAESGGGVALQVIGRIQLQGTEDPVTQIVGVATLRKGDTSVVVTTPAVTAESLVLLTPHANPGGQLWVNVKTGIFAIETSAAPTQDVRIAYLIIN